MGVVNVDITLYKRDILDFYFYVEDIPSHIVFSWLPERVGGIQLNCFGESIAAVGIVSVKALLQLVYVTVF